MLAGSTAYFEGNLSKPGEDWVSPEIHGILFGCIARITIGIFCGEELAQDFEWVETCKQFTMGCGTGGSKVWACDEMAEEWDCT